MFQTTNQRCYLDGSEENMLKTIWNTLKLAWWFATDPPKEFLNNLLIPQKLFNPAPMPSDFQGRPHRWCSRCQNDRWSYRHLLHLRKSRRIRPWRDFEARAPSSRLVSYSIVMLKLPKNIITESMPYTLFGSSWFILSGLVLVGCCWWLSAD